MKQNFFSGCVTALCLLGCLIVASPALYLFFHAMFRGSDW